MTDYYKDICNGCHSGSPDSTGYCDKCKERRAKEKQDFIDKLIDEDSVEQSIKNIVEYLHHKKIYKRF